ncbi:hypothetical protein PR048_008030 [Dryococelus australis]|uniref:Uncharacterized protein n=1 Tax=Dryococelus australis TaxID=614101 RepID=A0ABQ9HVY5_9NEOP|nr:hypothetical protein PR048_008030 [Dryococelus australis]
MKGREKREIPDKTRRSIASSSTIPTCENPGVTWPAIEPVRVVLPRVTAVFATLLLVTNITCSQIVEKAYHANKPIAIGRSLLEKQFSDLTGLLGIWQLRHSSYAIRVQTVNPCQKNTSANQDSRVRIDEYSYGRDPELLECRSRWATSVWTSPVFLTTLLPPKANRVRFPVGYLPEFRMRESCRMMPLVGAFPRGSPISQPLHFDVAPYSPRFTLIGSQYLDVKSQPKLFTHPLNGSLGIARSLERVQVAQVRGIWGRIEKKTAMAFAMERSHYSPKVMSEIWMAGSGIEPGSSRMRVHGGGKERREKRKIPGKTRRPAASSDTIPTCVNQRHNLTGNLTQFALVEDERYSRQDTAAPSYA